jgi:protoheme IX farnesyltransferase
MRTEARDMAHAGAHSLFGAYLELTKPRILTMVLVTAVLGYFLAAGTLEPYGLLIYMLIGTGMASGGAGAWNHVLERDVDQRMDRTRHRPLPSGMVSPVAAAAFGTALVFGGTALLYVQVNPLAAALAFLSAWLYIFVYTPLKRFSWLNTPMGAIPGAIPPMIGWAAAKDELNAGAFVLFFILFLWQHPHFYAIAWMFRQDYAKGGFKMLPVVRPDGKSTFRQSLAACILLIPVSLWPTFVGMSGWLYFVGALAIGLWFLAACVRWRMSESALDARKVLLVSVTYLPLLLLLMIVDSIFFHRGI